MKTLYQKPKDIPYPEKNVLSCCPDAEFPIQDGFYVCNVCGLVKEQVLEFEQPYANFGELVGQNNGYCYKPLRHYKPINHFREHLKSFLSSHPIAFPSSLLDSLRHIPIHQPNAFFLIRKELKKMKESTYYKHIWSLISELGGRMNVLTDQQFHQCLNLFKVFLTAFRLDPRGRKNLPSHNMILHNILKVLKVNLYYETPGLNNEKLRKNVENTIRRCLESTGQIYVKN